MDTPILKILACPACNTHLQELEMGKGLLCPGCGLLFQSLMISLLCL